MSKVTVVAILDNGKERDVVFSDGTTITQFWSGAFKMWVCVPASGEDSE